jgi:hypothetical protein
MNDDPLKAAIDRMFAKAFADLSVNPPQAVATPPHTITVHKYSGYLQLSTDQLLDAGLITEDEARAQGWTRHVPPPTPWRSRVRRRWQAWRERTGRKVGGWLAGVDLSETDEDW